MDCVVAEGGRGKAKGKGEGGRGSSAFGRGNRTKKKKSQRFLSTFSLSLFFHSAGHPNLVLYLSSGDDIFFPI